MRESAEDISHSDHNKCQGVCPAQTAQETDMHYGCLLPNCECVSLGLARVFSLKWMDTKAGSSDSSTKVTLFNPSLEFLLSFIVWLLKDPWDFSPKSSLLEVLSLFTFMVIIVPHSAGPALFLTRWPPPRHGRCSVGVWHWSHPLLCWKKLEKEM